MKKIRLTLLLLASALAACSEKDEDKPDPTTVQITSVKVITMPLTDAGDPWDLDGDADVYVQVESPSAVLYKYPTFYQDVQSSSLPLLFPFQPAYTLPLMDQSYYIMIWDYDATSADDFISNASFNPNDFKSARPATKTFSSGTAKVEVSFSWK